MVATRKDVAPTMTTRATPVMTAKIARGGGALIFQPLDATNSRHQSPYVLMSTGVATATNRATLRTLWSARPRPASASSRL